MTLEYTIKKFYFPTKNRYFCLVDTHKGLDFYELSFEQAIKTDVANNVAQNERT